MSSIVKFEITLMENKFNGSNYMEWKKRLFIVLTMSGATFAIQYDYPPETHGNSEERVR